MKAQSELAHSTTLSKGFDLTGAFDLFIHLLAWIFRTFNISKSMKQIIRYWLLLALVPALGCFSGSSLNPSSPTKALEDSIVFQPKKYPAGDWKPKDLSFEDAWFESQDGVRLHGWHCNVPQPRAVVLFCHGNAGNVADCYWNLRLWSEKLGASVLAFDYRGFGKSEGKPSEEGILNDARTARRWLANRARVKEQDIVLVGHSLGGAVAVDLAAMDGARGLILESTFSSIPEVAASKVPSAASIMTNRFNSVAKIPLYHGPLLQCHGDADRVVPIALGEKLFAAANQPKEFVRVPGGGHCGPPSADYLKALRRFVDNLP
jgi:fermentation-respiration switch protein FrsA (DUF1100 family)